MNNLDCCLYICYCCYWAFCYCDYENSRTEDNNLSFVSFYQIRLMFLVFYLNKLGRVTWHISSKFT
ncbi:hypothetical protein Hanom_Chr06g00547351 [Helianthus anomalus]